MIVRVVKRFVTPEYLWHGAWATGFHASVGALCYLLAWTNPGNIQASLPLIHWGQATMRGVPDTAFASVPYAIGRTAIDAVFGGRKPR